MKFGLFFNSKLIFGIYFFQKLKFRFMFVKINSFSPIQTYFFHQQKLLFTLKNLLFRYFLQKIANFRKKSYHKVDFQYK